MNIKQAVIEDLKEIQELNLLLFEEEYKWEKSLNLAWTFSKEGTDYFKNAINSKEFCTYVCYSNTVVSGYLVGSIAQCEGYKKSVKVAEVADMFVLPTYRQRGIGTSLYNGFINWCLGVGVNTVKVQATFQNKKAVGFYKKMGLSEGSIILEKILQEETK